MNKYDFKIGDKFGEWEIIAYAGLKSKNSYWTCKCSCGKVFDIEGTRLRNGQISCGHLNSKGEYQITQLLSNADIHFESQWKDERFKTDLNNPYRFDFAIYNDNNQLKFLLEYQGEQHYLCSKNGWFTEKELKKIQKRDQRKYELCQQYHIPLEVIPYTELNDIEEVLFSLLKKYQIL